MEYREIRIVNRREDARGAAEMVECFAEDFEIPRRIVIDLNVTLDEVLTNIISHAFEPGDQGEIVVRLAYSPSELQLIVEDTGRAFDPMQAPRPDLGAPLQARRVGGLGIHFIKSLMDEVVYERADGRNRLSLKKQLPATQLKVRWPPPGSGPGGAR
jgi:serine/threonine-protein kinase RsbW